MDLLSTLATATGGSVSDQLPSKQDIIVDYLLAIVAFWIIGAAALIVVCRFKK